MDSALFPCRYFFGGGGGDGLGFVIVIFPGLACSPYSKEFPSVLIEDPFVRFLPGYGFSSLAIIYSS